MSEDQARAFIERMKSDEAFRAKVMAEEDVEARLALIHAEGFDFSVEEMAALQEVDDAELGGAVSGGEVSGAGGDPGACTWPVYAPI